MRFQYAYYMEQYSEFENMADVHYVPNRLDPFIDLYVLAGKDEEGFFLASLFSGGYDRGFIERVAEAAVRTVDSLCSGDAVR